MHPEDEITDLDQLPQSLPGHSISLTPEIKLDDEIILTAPATVDAFTMETTLAFEVQQLVGNTKWAVPYQTPIPKGSYVAIMANAGSVSTHATAPSTRCSTRSSSAIIRPLSSTWPMPESNSPAMCGRPSMATCNAGGWSTDSCACAATPVAPRSCWRSAASGADSAPVAVRGAWPMARPGWSTKSCLSGRFVSGY